MRPELKEYNLNDPYAFATYEVDPSYTEKIAEEIAIGQSLGAWDPKFTSIEVLKQKVAKVISIQKTSNSMFIEVGFPFELWHGNLNFLLTLIFGKISFYPNIKLNNLRFTESCFKQSTSLIGPKHTIESLRQSVGLEKNAPLLMGILKPNVALSIEHISDLCIEAAEAGIHLIKDDEIRFDANEQDIIKRAEKIHNEFEKRNLKTIYSIHLQVRNSNYLKLAKELENAGAKSLLLNTYVTGIGTLQELRENTDCVIMSHPAFGGAFSQSRDSAVHPRVTYGQLLRAAGADLTLFPSPYGKIGIDKNTALSIKQACDESSSINPLIPVPSAGIKPEHAPKAKEDFGSNFVLNAGTAIFATEKSIKENVVEFRKALY